MFKPKVQMQIAGKSKLQFEKLKKHKERIEKKN